MAPVPKKDIVGRVIQLLQLAVLIAGVGGFFFRQGMRDEQFSTMVSDAREMKEITRKQSEILNNLMSHGAVTEMQLSTVLREIEKIQSRVERLEQRPAPKGT